ncbi:hypothetical protein BDA96_03G475600 [Sorghum bicolor]|uniref:Uncharacterized protein n=1 Tax=Sorghum bicolor TaxID=4558 RepID=A0A921UQZ3_SORBI|nr:hypothetical protein BDA96_03G475600 [Sorghum bicolor]
MRACTVSACLKLAWTTPPSWPKSIWATNHPQNGARFALTCRPIQRKIRVHCSDPLGPNRIFSMCHVPFICLEICAPLYIQLVHPFWQGRGLHLCLLYVFLFCETLLINTHTRKRHMKPKG